MGCVTCLTGTHIGTHEAQLRFQERPEGQRMNIWRTYCNEQPLTHKHTAASEQVSLLAVVAELMAGLQPLLTQLASCCATTQKSSLCIHHHALHSTWGASCCGTSLDSRADTHVQQQLTPGGGNQEKLTASCGGQCLPPCRPG